LQCAHNWQQNWNYILTNTDENSKKTTDELYTKLNNKLDRLRSTNKDKPHATRQQTTNRPDNIELPREKTFPFYNRVQNIKDINFSKDEINVLQRGFQYNLKTTPKRWTRDLIIDTETAICQLDENKQDAYLHLVCKKINKILLETSIENTLHKRQMYILKQIRKNLQIHNAIVAPADKGKTIVIINNNEYNKINHFSTTNNFHLLQKKPTDKYQKQIISIIQHSNNLTDKQKTKYLIQINPTPPRLKARLKIHKEDNPIRPVVNNINALSYKLAKYIHEKLQDLTNLPNIYTSSNSIDLA
jgi:hypothetical protein